MVHAQTETTGAVEGDVLTFLLFFFSKLHLIAFIHLEFQIT